MKKTLVIFSLILISTFALEAQNRSVAKDVQKIDTTAATKAADQAMDLLSKEQMMRLQDSLTEVAMRLEIENTAEIKTRRALEEKLDIKRREDSVRLEKLKTQIDLSKKNAIGYYVVLAGDTLRRIYTSFGTLTPEERAQVSTERIKEISKLYVPAFDTLEIVNEGTGVEILFKNVIFATVTQSDAIWEHKDAMEIAREISRSTHLAIIKYKELTSWQTIVKQVLLSLLVIVSTVLLILLITKVYRKRSMRFFVSKEGKWFKGWNYKDYEFMNSKKQVRFILSVTKFVRLMGCLVVLFFAFPLMFSIFPITQRFADVIFGWVLTPVNSFFWGLVKFLPDLFVILIIILITRYAVRGVRYIMSEIGNGRLKIKGFYPDWAHSTYNIIRIFLYAFAVVLIYPRIPNSESKVFQNVSLFLGALVSISSTSIISNMVAGLVITYMRPFRVGDHIKIGEITGDVLEKTAFVIRILTHKQEVVTLPNSNVLSASVVNYSTMVQEHKAVIYHTTVTMGYETPWRQVHECLIEAALRCDLVLKKPAPFVIQKSLDDFYVSYQLCPYTKHPEKQQSVYTQLHQNIQDVFNENGLELMSIYYRGIRVANDMVIPEQYIQHNKPEEPVETLKPTSLTDTIAKLVKKQ